jgi:hypothetical protein
MLLLSSDPCMGQKSLDRHQGTGQKSMVMPAKQVHLDGILQLPTRVDLLTTCNLLTCGRALHDLLGALVLRGTTAQGLIFFSAFRLPV